MALESGSLGAVRGPDFTRMAVRRMWRDARRRKDGAGMLKALDEADARGSTVSGSVTQDEDTAMRGAAAQAGRRSQMIEAMVIKSMRDRLQSGKARLGTDTASKTVPEAPSSSAVSPENKTTEYKPDGSTTKTSLLGDEGNKGASGAAGAAGAAGEGAEPSGKAAAEDSGGIPWRKGQEPAKPGEWFNADTGQIETGPRPTGFKEVGISGSRDTKRISYGRDTTTAPMRSAEDINRQKLNEAYSRYQARKRDVAEASRTPGGMDMVRRNRAQEAAAREAKARASEAQVTKDLFGQADETEAAIRRNNPEGAAAKPSIASRTRREKQIRDEINKRKQRETMIRRFGA